MKRWAALTLSLLFLGYTPTSDILPAGVTAPLAEQRYIALTFDDGPKAGTTDRLLEGLALRDVRATFFLIGEQIPGHEDLVRQMYLAGHQIGTHTQNHAWLSGADKTEVYYQLQETYRLLDEVLETKGDWWLRPPYGVITPREAAWVTTPMIQWTVDPEDWRYQDAQRVADHIVTHVRPGDIILLHDIYPTSVDAALAAIDTLQAQGYTFVTVEELFQLSGVTPKAGMLYMNPVKPMYPT